MTELVSVVMPTLNQRAFIEEAVGSVLTQKGINIELIVADGGSTDGTLQWLHAKANIDCRIRLHTEADSGPAQAINRAIQLSRGTLIGWLNSDDCYTEGALERAVEVMRAHPKVLMLYGNARHIDETGSDCGPYPSHPGGTNVHEFHNGCFICQPTVLLRRTFCLLNGPLNETFQTAFDFDWWLRAYKRFPERIAFFDSVQAKSRLHSGCITLRQRRLVALESMQVLHCHLGKARSHWIKTWVNEALESGEIAHVCDQKVYEVTACAAKWMSPEETEELGQWLSEQATLAGQRWAVP